MVRYFGQATGRVQGVGFRFFVQKNGEELGLTGWVRNMSDGSVTMEMQGEQEKVEELTRRIQAGNFFIKVKSLSLDTMEPVPGEEGFSIRY